MSGILLLAFMVLSSHNHLLGDGYTLLANVSAQSMSSPTEPLDYMVHHAVYKVLGSDSDAAIMSYRVCTYICGLLFLIGLYRSVERKQLLLIAVPVSLAFPVVQFFFGYVESYTFSFTFAILYLISAGIDLESRRLSLTTIVLLLLAIGFHLSSAIFLPSLIYLIWNKYHRRSALIVSATALLVLFVGGIAYAHFELQLERIFLPIVATQNNPYGLLSVAHFRDLINIFLLDYPLLLLMAPALVVANFRHRWFYLAALLPALLFMLSLDPKIGALRDWDLLSIASAPSIVALIWIFANNVKQYRNQVYALSLPLLLFALLHTGSWIAANTSKEFSYQYIADVTDADPHYSTKYYQGYQNRGWGAVLYDDYNDHERVIKALEKRVKAEPEDSLSRINLAKFYYLYTRQYRRAAELVEGRWMGFLVKPEAIKIIAAILKTAGYGADYNRLCEAVTLSGGTDPKLMFSYLDALIDRGRIDSASAFCYKAMDLWSQVSPDKRLNVCLMCRVQEHSQAAESCLRSLEPFLPEDSKSLIDKLLTASTDNDRATVDSLQEQIANLLR